MTDPDQDEFVALRRRAYGRDADIHLDPVSLARLEELENARTVTAEDGSRPSVDAERPEPDEAVTVEPTPEDPAPTPWWREAMIHVAPAARRLGRWLRRRRRSTVLIALGTAMTAATLVTALTVIQRVQTDPLQVGAVQVARLTVDRAFTSPFPDPAVPGGADVETRGFQTFHGLRAMTGPPLGFSPLGSDADSVCLNIYVESTLQVQNNGWSGSIYSACSAGDFPAMLQLPLDLSELPDEVRAAYPDARGVQFVYDRENDEVVVFADR